MEGDTAIWIIIWILTCIAGYLYGTHIESQSSPKPKQKYQQLNKEEEKFENVDTKDENYYKAELEKEKLAKKKITQGFEQQIDQLKSEIAQLQAKAKELTVIYDQKPKDANIFEEASNVGLPTVQVVEGTFENFEDEVNKELTSEF